MMINKFMRGALVASLLALAACAGQKGPATTAMTARPSWPVPRR
jgi:predicted outer membrane protein